ncbi:hypothetical protein DSLPV1_185 [Dishui lake phycodnavirus 1]|uniref:hypothetical protein n=1 Tax=Dishui lake phycodnavirus 1 TaxID=2079134 RepID=UPI000CD6A542|nr:hypothetical protein C5Y57_gp213 [Dishui lake phycodnavirus 1]AUT19156.1 hypothetical protein DSLPV1_185 [Dishui lake phycodnavirus 1]
MRVVRLNPSPISTKKWRVTLPDGDTVDFGARGYDDYTTHKNSSRMRNYVRRHGGMISKKLENETESSKIHSGMLGVDKSAKEIWGIRGIKTAGFWSRWLLWSQPSLNKAIKFMEKKFNMRFT